MNSQKGTSLEVAILGTRGIPAAHGGFETFAEKLALYLVRRNWQVTVYCQEKGGGDTYETVWNGVRLIHVPSRGGSLSSILFDWKTNRMAVKRHSLLLTLGYNTAVFGVLARMKGVPNIMNMDGIEWRRAKWSLAAKAWLYSQEKAGSWISDHLIADHPEIAAHLHRNVLPQKITVIPYGAEEIEKDGTERLDPYNLSPQRYVTVVARPEPENSILEVVRAFSARPRVFKLVVLGNYDPARNHYHRAVVDAASQDVLFLGAIYDQRIVSALRVHCALYVHGHQVGGTNPSLVEALGAGNAVLAHDNRFNRWVAGDGALFFDSEQRCVELLDRVLADEGLRQSMAASSRRRFKEEFTWASVLEKYESLLSSWHPSNASR